MHRRSDAALTTDLRVDAIRRAAVWRPTDVGRIDIRNGPRRVGGFAPDAVVDCTYVKRDMNGRTPKFTCALPGGDEVKVKFGLTNGEVYAEVAATRLLWALGFGADAMFPVRVRCHQCPRSLIEFRPETPLVENQGDHSIEFPHAAIERKMTGTELADADGGGWSWPELRLVAAGGRRAEAVAQRDALTLLAALLQHTDSKRDQQRLVCLDGGRQNAAARRTTACAHPFMLISDLGKTFGRANVFNRDGPGSVNLAAWRSVDVWLGRAGCRANLSRSATGTLENPVISDAGRRFLARLLRQLTDRQLVDLFTVAQFTTRTDARGDVGRGEVADWVAAFKDKVRQVDERTCGDSPEAE